MPLALYLWTKISISLFDLIALEAAIKGITAKGDDGTPTSKLEQLYEEMVLMTHLQARLQKASDFWYSGVGWDRSSFPFQPYFLFVM